MSQGQLHQFCTISQGQAVEREDTHYLSSEQWQEDQPFSARNDCSLHAFNQWRNYAWPFFFCIVEKRGATFPDNRSVRTNKAEQQHKNKLVLTTESICS